MINGVAKTYAMTGWRVGWMIGPHDVIKAATNLQSHATSNVANVSQMAALAALTGDHGCVAADAGGLRPPPPHSCTTLLDEIAGRDLPRARGRLLRLPVLRRGAGARDRRPQPATTLELADVLLDEAKVAIVPGEAFGAPGYARLSYALGDEQLEEGVHASRQLAKLDLTRSLRHSVRPADGLRPFSSRPSSRPATGHCAGGSA